MQNTVGERIKIMRQRKGWTQDELALKSEVSQVTISGIEVGTSNFRMATIKKIAEAFGVHPNDLLGGTGEVPALNSSDPWKDEAYSILKHQVEKLEEEKLKLWSMVEKLMGGPLIQSAKAEAALFGESFLQVFVHDHQCIKMDLHRPKIA